MYHSQCRAEQHYIRLNFQPSLDSEDDFRSGNVNHHQQSFLGLISPGRSNSIQVCDAWVQTIFYFKGNYIFTILSNETKRLGLGHTSSKVSHWYLFSGPPLAPKQGAFPLKRPSTQK